MKTIEDLAAGIERLVRDHIAEVQRSTAAALLGLRPGALGGVEGVVEYAPDIQGCRPRPTTRRR